MKRILILVTLGFLVASSFLTGCGSQKIKVGSFPDPEGMLLAQTVILLLAENGFDVIDAGTFENCKEAVEQGKIDLYPTYSGYFIDIDKFNINGEELISTNYSGFYQENKNEKKDGTDSIVLLKPAVKANSQWAIVIREDLSQAVTPPIENMTDFGKYVRESSENESMERIKLVCSPDFVTDTYALPLFEMKYNFDLKEDQLITVPSHNFVYMWAQVASPLNDKNAGIAYTSGGKPEAYNLKLLVDDKGFQPTFNPVAAVRREIYNEYAEQLNQILTPLFASLNDEKLRELNSQSGLLGKQAKSEVARNFLVENGYFKYNELEMVQQAMEELRQAIGGDKWREAVDNKTFEHDETDEMKDFPSEDYPLCWDKDEKPDYAKAKDLLWPPLPWSKTIGTYTCDGEGWVEQVETGWD